MAGPRLPFLWPMLARGFEASNPAARSTRAAARMRAYHSSSPRKQKAPQQPRYGIASQPPPHLGGGKGMPPPTRAETAEQTKLPKIGEKLQKDGEAEIKADQAEPTKILEDKKEPATTDTKEPSQIQTDPMLDAADSRPDAMKPSAPDTPPDHPLESILETVPDPSQHSEEQQAQAKEAQVKEPPEEQNPDVSFDEHTPPVKAPHMNTPRHVHHFDTFGLVSRLLESGWTESQAITIMKGMRVLLADNMNIAQEALVSKSQVENETYLFRAACAELKTEVTARKKSEQEKMRTERTQLQHEVEILNQKLGQESAGLKDELKGMFDDRKMAVRNEQRSMESKIQRLNYQITVDLQADAKSEVEGLRWVMTRRVIIALGAVILMVIGALKLFSNALHEQDLDAKRRANMRSGGTQTEGNGNGNGQELVEGQQGQGGSDVSYVSLG